VRRNPSQQPCSSWMIVSLGLCLLACAITPAAGDWRSGDGYRFKTLTVSTNSQAGFTTLPADLTGIGFVNRLAKERYTTNQIYLNGSGVAAGDYDGDGLCDLFFCGLDSENKLYRNLGDWKFQDVTAKARVRGLHFSISIVPIPTGAKYIVISKADGVNVVH